MTSVPTVNLNGWPGSVVVDHGRSENIDFSIDGFSSPIHFNVEVPAQDWTLADIVPLAKRISEKMIDESLASLDKQGCQISCQKGCSACCNYFIPLSLPEAFYLNRKIESMPAADKHQVVSKCLSSANRMMNNDRPDFCDSQPDSKDTLERVSQWYEELDMPCPFLEDHSCSIYSDRPFSCREHFMTGASQMCNSPAGSAEPVEMSFNLSNALAILTSRLEDRQVEGVALPLFYVWSCDNQDRGLAKWPAKVMIETFIQIVQEMASEHSLVLSA